MSTQSRYLKKKEEKRQRIAELAEFCKQIQHNKKFPILKKPDTVSESSICRVEKCDYVLCCESPKSTLALSKPVPLDGIIFPRHIEEVLCDKFGFRFRKNVLSGDYEVFTPRARGWEKYAGPKSELFDYLKNFFEKHTAMWKGGERGSWSSVRQSRDGFSQVLTDLLSTYSPCVNPFALWLHALPEWDRKPRLENLFSTFFTIHDDDLEWSQHLSKLLCYGIGVRNWWKEERPVYEDGSTSILEREAIPAFHYLINLLGPQGCGKSSFVSALVGSVYHTDSVDLNVQSEIDFFTQFSGKIIGEVAEMNTNRKNDINRIKMRITKTCDSPRRLFTNDAMRVPRRCVFISTSNDVNAGVLFDVTGSRRFLPLEVGTKFEFDARDRIHEWFSQNREQLWSEVRFKIAKHIKARKKISELLRLENHLIPTQKHQVQKHSEDMVENFLRPLVRRLRVLPWDNKNRIAHSDIYNWSNSTNPPLDTSGKNPNGIPHIGSPLMREALQRAGCIRRRQARGIYWYKTQDTEKIWAEILDEDAQPLSVEPKYDENTELL